MEVSIREFRSHLSRYLARAQTGEELAVTSHKLPVARILGIAAASCRGLSVMLASGEVEWQAGWNTDQAGQTWQVTV